MAVKKLKELFNQEFPLEIVNILLDIILEFLVLGSRN